jgi:hypothetical protein
MIDNFEKHLQRYAKAQLELAKIEAKHELILSVSKIGIAIIFVLFLTTSFIFFSFAVAEIINEYSGKGFSGYLVIGSLYLILALILVFLVRRFKLHRKLMDYIWSIIEN